MQVHTSKFGLARCKPALWCVIICTVIELAIISCSNSGVTFVT